MVERKVGYESKVLAVIEALEADATTRNITWHYGLRALQQIMKWPAGFVSLDRKIEDWKLIGRGPGSLEAGFDLLVVVAERNTDPSEVVKAVHNLVDDVENALRVDPKFKGAFTTSQVGEIVEFAEIPEETPPVCVASITLTAKARHQG